MEVHLDSEESTPSGNKEMGKRRRPAGRMASSPAEVADQTGRLLVEREPEWLGRLTSDPASFAAVELEVHEQARRRRGSPFRNSLHACANLWPLCWSPIQSEVPMFMLLQICLVTTARSARGLLQQLADYPTPTCTSSLVRTGVWTVMSVCRWLPSVPWPAASWRIMGP